MEVLHLSTKDTIGGAARAAYRLHKGLKSNGIDSKMLVQKKSSDDSSIYGSKGWAGRIQSKVRREIDQLPLKKYPDRNSDIFSPNWIPEFRLRQIRRHDPDIVHLHWIADGFIKPSTIGEIDVPIVWTFHDMWPFTGGCHVSHPCKKYENGCESCPQLESDKKNDLSNDIWTRKYEAWSNSEFNIIAPSQWMAKCAKESELFSSEPIDIVPNGLNLESFYPRDSNQIKSRYSINTKTRLICFGSSYQASFKGYDLLFEALNKLNYNEIPAKVICFGSEIDEEVINDIPIKHIGFVKGQSLQQLYSDVDVTVVPSRVDNLPNIAVESLASGTPCVAFNIGGLPDIIDHKKTGYLADPFDTEDLAEGINWVTENRLRNKELSQRARVVAQHRFDIQKIVKSHNELYKRII